LRGDLAGPVPRAREGIYFYIFPVWNSINSPSIEHWKIRGDYTGADHAHKGWIDEIRILKGKAKWTADFTPETAEYPVQLSAW